MNKKNQQFVPLIFLFAIILFSAIIGSFVVPKFRDYNTAVNAHNKEVSNLKKLESDYQKEKIKTEQEEIQLQSIKQVYQANYNSKNENLGVFGTMFDEIIKKAQSNGLRIRSIEYDMKPTYNNIYNNFQNQYNVCELKFFFVGTYPQIRTFLNDMNTNFPYLVSISKLDITAFSGDTDYLLINMSITLYSKKPNSENI